VVRSNEGGHDAEVDNFGGFGAGDCRLVGWNESGFALSQSESIVRLSESLFSSRHERVSRVGLIPKEIGFLVASIRTMI